MTPIPDILALTRLLSLLIKFALVYMTTMGMLAILCMDVLGPGRRMIPCSELDVIGRNLVK